MKKKKVSKNVYIIAAVITGTIFILGLLLGLIIEGKRLAYIQSVAQEKELDLKSIQLQYEFLRQMHLENNCPAVASTFNTNINSLEDSRLRLENYKETAKINQDDFERLRREYALAQLNYFLLAKETRRICENEVATILYFYSDKETCPDCDKQAFILTYLKKKYKDRLLNFAFDERYEEEMIQILKNTYHMEEYPFLVIENKTFSGLTGKDEILVEICKYYPSMDYNECINS